MTARPWLLAESAFRISEKRAIAKNQALMRVNDGDALDHAAQDRARLIAFVAERMDCGVHALRGFVERSG